MLLSLLKKVNAEIYIQNLILTLFALPKRFHMPVISLNLYNCLFLHYRFDMHVLQNKKFILKNMAANN